MQFVQTPLPGAFLITPEPRVDARGLFARTVCEDEFARAGLNGHFVQQSVSWNPHPGTLRGMHYQKPPYSEDKLVRVTRGAIFDVIVDLREASPTAHQWFGVELTAGDRRQLYIPKGFAHGFQTLEANTEVLYEMTERFNADAASGFRWDDPVIGISWPKADNRLVGERDLALPPVTGTE